MHIFKYQIPVNDQDHIYNFGIESQIVHVDLQEHADVVLMWVLHNDSEAMREPKAFRVFGTGQTVPDEYTYIGTALYRTIDPFQGTMPVIEVPLVWHLFEKAV